MKYPLEGLFAALCGLSLLSGAAAAPLAELEAAAASSPEDFGKVFDNAAPAAGAADARAMTQEQLRQTMLADLDSIKNIFEARYAPAEWKGELNGWSLDAEVLKAKEAVNAQQPVSVAEYRKIVKRLFASTQDYHVSVSFHSTAVAVLPLSLTESGGRYYINGINRRVLPESAFPFKTGDEVTSIGGKSMDEAVAEYLAEAGIDNVPGTDRALAALRLTQRLGSRADDMPLEPATLSIKPAGAAEAVAVRLDWLRAEEQIPPQQFVAKRLGGDALPLDWMTVMYSDLFAGSGAETAGYEIGDRDGFLPDLGEKIWQAPSNSLFRAYIYRNPVDGKGTGYVRIPTYMVDNPDALAADFSLLAGEFERGADALVIDQLNNPGGIVPYMYRLLSMLTDSPLQVPLHRITLTPADVNSSVKLLRQTEGAKTDDDARKLLGDTFGSYPVDLAFLNDYRAFASSLIKQWGEGKTLTDPLPNFGVAKVNPAYGPRFTKPLLVLTNEADISCGDFFPAIMQDNRRGVTFGARTSGAGGGVKQYRYENSLLGMNDFGLTQTIAIRANGRPIESLGVTPDIPYAVQPGDLQTGFKAYAAAVNAAAAGLTR